MSTDVGFSQGFIEDMARLAKECEERETDSVTLTFKDGDIEVEISIGFKVNTVEGGDECDA